MPTYRQLNGCGVLGIASVSSSRSLLVATPRLRDAIRGREDVLAAAESVGLDLERVKPSDRYRTPGVLAKDGKPHARTGEMIESVLTADLAKSMWKGLSDIAPSKTSGLM